MNVPITAWSQTAVDQAAIQIVYVYIIQQNEFGGVSAFPNGQMFTSQTGTN